MYILQTHKALFRPLHFLCMQLQMWRFETKLMNTVRQKNVAWGQIMAGNAEPCTVTSSRSVCLQISVFSDKNLWEKSQPRYAPYSSCKGAQVYEPRGDQGIKHIYYFYCSARFKKLLFLSAFAKNILPTICPRRQSLQGSAALQSTFSHHQTAESWHNNHHSKDTKEAVRNSQAVNLAILTSSSTIIQLSDKWKVK